MAPGFFLGEICDLQRAATSRKMSLHEVPTAGRMQLTTPEADEATAADWKAQWLHVVRRIRVVESDDELHQLIDTATSQRGVTVVAFVNAHSLNSLSLHQDRMQGLEFCDYLLRDGVGVSTLMRLLGLPPGLNLNGTDLIPAILLRRRFEKVALFGTIDEYVHRAGTKLQFMTGLTSRQVTTLNGFHPIERYVEVARRFQPSCIVLGMGTPKQEEVAALLRDSLEHDCVVLCGGAIIDFMAGRFKRAPRAVRALRMEWVYRLRREPVRLFRRYVIGNPLFMVRSCRVALASNGSEEQHRRSP